ncbi:MAG: type II toxin-antitoxin system HicA family toxin [Armatimonadetes bacterium]|nr:type II toxin-antitoxin system HicA family toxin [Armatimonadota bacterium]
MTKKLPRLSARDIISLLEKKGFSFSRQSGSHKIYKDKMGKRVTVPYHSGKILHPKIIENILEDANLSMEDLKK